MLVSDITFMARATELKQVVVKDDPALVLSYYNMGVLELHKRFNMIQQQAVITMVDEVYEYKLDNLDPNVQLNLNGNQFLMVDDAYNYDGCQLPINDETEEFSIATPAFNVVEIPDIALTPTQNINLIYRAAPSFVTEETGLVPLPPQFYEALLHYMGYRGHSSIKLDKQGENNTRYQKFVNSCNQIKADGLYTGDSMKSHKFLSRGFV